MRVCGNLLEIIAHYCPAKEYATTPIIPTILSGDGGFKPKIAKRAPIITPNPQDCNAR